jgi:hypothetical protein
VLAFRGVTGCRQVPDQTKGINMTTKEMQCYGCDIEQFVASVTSCITYKFNGANMVIAGLMSDAQEAMAFGDTENARQSLNRAKYLLFKVMDGQLIGTKEG